MSVISRLRSTSARWGMAAIVLHWTVAGLIFAAIAVGLTATRLTTDLGERFDLTQTHKSLGLTVLLLSLARLLWRSVDARPEWIGGSIRLHRAARLVHGLLLFLCVALPFTGWLMASASPLRLPTVWFGLWTVPALIGPDAGTEKLLRAVHVFLAWLLIGLVVLHLAAALKHHLFDRDDTLTRMLPR